MTFFDWISLASVIVSLLVILRHINSQDKEKRIDAIIAIVVIIILLFAALIFQIMGVTSGTGSALSRVLNVTVSGDDNLTITQGDNSNADVKTDSHDTNQNGLINQIKQNIYYTNSPDAAPSTSTLSGIQEGAESYIPYADSTMDNAGDDLSKLSYGFSSSAGDRETYTLDQINNGILGDDIVFNSILDNSIRSGSLHDERDFVSAREDNGINRGKENRWSNNITAEEGKTYIIRLFYHNNSPKGINATAVDASVEFDIPTVAARNIVVRGIISAKNSRESWYSDTTVFTADRPFILTYDVGSAMLENNGFSPTGAMLTDDIVEKPVLIGFNDLNGRLPGCYGYSGYISIRVKPIFIDGESVVKVNDSPTLIDPDDVFHADLEIRNEESQSCCYELDRNLHIGDKVYFEIDYKNMTQRKSDDIFIKVNHSDCLKIIDGTTKVYDAENDDGKIIEDGIDSDGVYIGSYDPKEYACVHFQAEIVDPEDSNGEGVNNGSGDGSLDEGVNYRFCSCYVQDGNNQLSRSVDIVVEK